MLRKVLLICAIGMSVPFKLKCPHLAQWSLRASAFCPADPSKYSCIQNGIIKEFTEDCSFVVSEKGGTKTILRGNFDATPCSKGRYQPGVIKYLTNVSSGCIFAKSQCSEEGQMLNDTGSPTTDVTCRCDYTQNYDFIFRPLASMLCKPSGSDCSCFRKECLTYYELSPDYTCILRPTLTTEPILKESRNKTVLSFILQKTSNNREKLNLIPCTVIITMLTILVFPCSLLFCCDQRIDRFIDRKIRKVYFLHNLEEEVNVVEGNSVKLTCELSKEDVPVQWLKDGIPIQLPSFRIITESDGGVHILTIRDSNMKDVGVFALQADRKTSKKINLIVQPYFATDLKPITIIEGEDVVLECRTVGSLSDVSCNWFVNDKEIDDLEKYHKKQSGKNLQLKIREAKLEDSGVYKIKIGNVARHTELKVKSYYRADLRPIPCLDGGECLLECEVNEDNMNATWFKDMNVIEKSDRILINVNGTKHQLKILDVGPDDGGYYKVTVNNVSRQADVKVTSLFTTRLTNLTCMESLEVFFTCEVANRQLKAKWSKDGIPIEENSDFTCISTEGIHKLCIHHADKSKEGLYRINVGNRSSEAHLKVAEMPLLIKQMQVEDRNRYLRTAKDGTMKRQHIRIMIVGKYSAGKTSLMRRLLMENIDDVVATDGINVEVRRCKVRISDGQWIFSKEKCQKQDFEEKFKRAFAAKIKKTKHPESFTITNKEQLEDMQIQSNMTNHPFYTDTMSTYDDDSNIQNGIQQTSEDIQNDKSNFPKESRVLKEANPLKLTNHDDTKSMGSFESQNEEHKEEILEERYTHLSKNIYTDESIENKESDQLYVLSNAMQSENKTENIDCADVDFWDFAGQEDFYATHQTFLTMNAIYLLTIDLSSYNKDQRAQQEGGKLDNIGGYTNYWLDCIHCFSRQCRNEKVTEREPPVIIVCTGIDKVKDLHDEIKCFKRHLIDNISADSKRYHIRDIIYLSNINKEEDNFDDLRSKIWSTAKKMSSWNDELPLPWIHLEKQLQAKSEKNSIISFEKVMEIGRESIFPVTIKDDVMSFLRVHHEMGSIIFFDKLQEYIILKPVWLVDAFSCLVSPSEFQKHHLGMDNLNEIADTGEIKIDYIKQMFTKVPELNFLEHKDHLLKVMEEFDIIVKPKSRQLLPIQQNYYIPCLIKYGTFATVSDIFGINLDKCRRTSWVCLEFDFLPPAFFNHILIHLMRIYHVSEVEVKSRLALYRSLGVLDLNNSGTSKLVLCTSKNTIAFQIWQWFEDKLQFINIRTKIEGIVYDVIKRYQMNIKFDVKYKCRTGTYSKRTGRKSYSELKQLKTYYCLEHTEQHDAKETISVWQEEMAKVFDEDTNDLEENEQITCQTCSSIADHWCFECQNAMCTNCNQQHTIALSKHIVQNLSDKYILNNTFSVNSASICDIKMLGKNILVANYTGKKLILYDMKGLQLQSVPLLAGPRKIAIFDLNRVAVRLFRDTKVLIVDIYTQYTHDIDVKENCHGIMCMNNNIFVGCDDCTLRVFDMNGEKIKTIDMPLKPWYICHDSKNRIFCTEEYNTNVLSCFDQDGMKLFIISNHDIVGAAGITVDDDQCVLLSCKNSNNIHRINPDDQKTEIIISNIPGSSKDWFPYVCFDSQSKSLVVAREDNVYVYTKQIDS